VLGAIVSYLVMLVWVCCIWWYGDALWCGGYFSAVLFVGLRRSGVLNLWVSFMPRIGLVLCV